ncbi:SDR family NAD(P)-dependent oxidoreductase [Oceaniglobus trochenteri]|uniref:SDR family NAD(P)-dependent oxidoreductase n=1 Tax=Oceaniglobus trochenteri TaxID=2763260 RepID=UPI001CFF977F|nr:SDR family oxidoreductase [Oceaniglobus trochenteri]
MGRVQDKVVVVTGGAAGIGHAIAQGMAQEGAQVVLGDIDDAAGEAVASAIGGTFRHCDVSSFDDVSALIEATVQKHGRIDVLVNNAAVPIGGMPVHDMTLEQWDKLIATNLSSVFYGVKAALPHMIAAGKGAIVNMASAQGHVGLDGWTAYSGAKGAIMSMTRQMAVEFGPKGIRVNSISPGTIDTPMNQQVVAELGTHLTDTWVKMHPIGRIGKPQEVAEAAIYLASDAAGFTTGVDLKVDGGLSGAPRFVPEFFMPRES